MLIVHSSDEMYGADRIVLQVIDAVREHAVGGDDVELWLPDDCATPPRGVGRVAAEAPRRVAVSRQPLPVLRRSMLTAGGLAGLLLRLLRSSGRLAVRRRRHDHLYLATSAMLLLAPMARLLGYRRVTLHVQEIWASRERVALGLLARAAHDVVCISDAVRDSLPARARDRATVVWNAVPDVAPTPLPDGPLTLLVASRWNSWKGHRTLLDALGRVHRDVRLLVLGGPPPLGVGYDLRRAVAEHPRRDRIEVIGEVSDVLPYVRRAHVVVVPSDQPEPFGLVAIEAFRSARPVIASAAGGIAQVVDHGRTGWLFPPGDAAALAGLIEGLAKEDLGAFGEAARREYEELFAPARFGRRIAEHLR